MWGKILKNIAKSSCTEKTPLIKIKDRGKFNDLRRKELEKENNIYVEKSANDKLTRKRKSSSRSPSNKKKSKHSRKKESRSNSTDSDKNKS